jgi:DNA repair protein RadC
LRTFKEILPHPKTNILKKGGVKLTAESILKRAYGKKAKGTRQQEPELAPIYRAARCKVCLIKENDQLPKILINTPVKAYELVKDELESSDRETLLSILLATDLHLIGIETVAMGSINTCGSTVAEIFRSAILANAAYIVMAHNHPSGNLEVSSEDLAFTRNVIKCGKLLGIIVHDHLVVSSRGFVSMKEKGLLTETEKPF